jgi:Cu(I)/Ag(I) efflux system membrane protein CusA/SilA
MVMLGLPLCLVGAIWYLALLDYNMSIAVWVGILALAGTAAETSAAMLVYLDGACTRRKTAGGLRSLQDLLDTVHAGAVERVRPIVMVSVVDILGLVPTMWATGTGADVMKRLAAPTVGGVLSGMLLTLIVIPALYAIWRWHTEVKYAVGKNRQARKEIR